jgi:hypothetical protein
MRWARNVAGKGEMKFAYRVFVRKLRKRDHLKELNVDGRIILNYIFKKWDGDMDLIDLAQNRDRWRALVNAVTNLRVPQNAGNFLTS